MILEPFYDGWMYLPTSKIKDIAGLKQSLTLHSKFKDMQTGEKKPPLHLWDEDTYDNFIGIPPRFAFDRYKKTFGDAYSDRFHDHSFLTPEKDRILYKKLPDLNHEKAHPEQKDIVPQLLKALEEQRNTMLIAPPGTGKTAMTLYVAGFLGLRTLVVVKSNNLAQQWIKEIENHLGIPAKEVGTVQGEKCKIGKQFTIAMVQTNWKGKYTDELRDKFDLVIFDEAHNMGAEKYHKFLGKTNAYYNIGITAEDRKDGWEKAYQYFLGNSDIKAKGAALPIKVHVMPYNTYVDNWGKDRQQKILCITRDNYRNIKIANLVLNLYNKKRQILVLSDHRKQLFEIYKHCLTLGIPPEIFGHFWNNDKNLQKPANCGKDKEHFEWLKQDAQIILATYAMMKEGISIDRLDAGIDATPRADAVQIIGRIRRPFKGKPMPVWFTIRDDDVMLSKFCDSRIRDYQADPTVTLVRHDKK